MQGFSYLKLGVVSLTIAVVVVALPALATQKSESVFSQSSDCLVCHDGKSMTDNSTLAKKHEALQLGCSVCHDDAEGLQKVHEGVTPDDKMPKKLKMTAVASEACLTCHQKDELVKATEGSTVLTDGKQTVVNPHELSGSEKHDTVECASCHRAHKAKADPLVDAPKACKSCHHQGVYECGTCHE